MDRRSFLCAAALSPLLNACATSAAPPLRGALQADFDEALARAAAALPSVPAFGVAVVTHGGAYVRTIGVTEVGGRELATPDTAFYIASSTKALTALAMALLDRRGAIDLDQTIAAFAPDAPFPASARPDAVRL